MTERQRFRAQLRPREALAGDAEASATFDRLSFSHRREDVWWITDAKRPETRARRVAGAFDRLREGKPRR